MHTHPTCLNTKAKKREGVLMMQSRRFGLKVKRETGQVPRKLRFKTQPVVYPKLLGHRAHDTNQEVGHEFQIV